jgi:hypothetical protein
MKPSTSQGTSWTWLQMAQGPKHEAGKLQGPGQKMLKLVWQGALSKPWRRQRQGSTCIREQVNNWPRSIGERDGADMGLGRSAQTSRPGLFWARFAPPFCPRCSSIYCLCLRRPPHPSIHQRATNTKEKHWEEANSHCRSSSYLGDGLGHALAAMVGPAWWSHGGVLEPCLGSIKAFVLSTFDGDINQSLSLLWSTTSCAYSYV